MGDYLLIKRIKVENANAIAGLTWGFPAISNFLGFIHSLSRYTSSHASIGLVGCGVIAHEHETKAHRSKVGRDFVFSLTRNPLTKNAEPAPFVEEGKMHCTVSLITKIEGDLRGENSSESFERLVRDRAYMHRLAGGIITSIGAVEVLSVPESEEAERNFHRRSLYQLLPGHALVDRSNILSNYIVELKEANQFKGALDALLDFCTLRWRYTTEDSMAKWTLIPKPARGWLVPISIGYAGISPVYSPGEVAKVRDPAVPFAFVENLYSLGEWMSPHRANDLADLIWHYSANVTEGLYLCENKFSDRSKHTPEFEQLD